MKKRFHKGQSKQILESFGERIFFTQPNFVENMPIRHLLLQIATGFIILAFTGACGSGGGSGSGSSADGDGTTGLITIDYPTTDTRITENCYSSITIGGEVRYDEASYPGDIPWSTGWNLDYCIVEWENKKTGDSGAVQCWYDRGCEEDPINQEVICTYPWKFETLLEMGDNNIVVNTTDPAENYGDDSITVTKPWYAYNISGSVVNTNGIALGCSEPIMEMHLKGENIDSYAAVESDGSYSFTCIPEGSYTITLELTMDYNYEPKSHTVYVNNGDVTGVDFVVEAYLINGRVASSCRNSTLSIRTPWEDGLPQKTISVPYSNVRDIGEYHVAVPNGTYDVGIRDNVSCPCSTSCGGGRVIVNNEDVYNIDAWEIASYYVYSLGRYSCHITFCLDGPW